MQSIISRRDSTSLDARLWHEAIKTISNAQLRCRAIAIGWGLLIDEDFDLSQPSKIVVSSVVLSPQVLVFELIVW